MEKNSNFYLTKFELLKKKVLKHLQNKHEDLFKSLVKLDK